MLHVDFNGGYEGSKRKSPRRMLDLMPRLARPAVLSSVDEATDRGRCQPAPDRLLSSSAAIACAHLALCGGLAFALCHRRLIDAGKLAAMTGSMSPLGQSVMRDLTSGPLDHRWIDRVCDHCGCEIRRGSRVRCPYRSGRLHCCDCAAITR